MSVPYRLKFLVTRLKSGLIYKNSPRLARIHADAINSSRCIGDRAADFGPEFTKLKQ